MQLRGRGSAVASVVLTGLALAAGAVLARHVFELGPLFVAIVLLGFGACAGVLVVLSGKHLAGRSFGSANHVTLARGALIAVLLGLLGERAPDAAIAWLVVGVASLALVSDGIDGWLARRQGTASAFGARFDMETDALLILAVAALAWQLGKAGPWVLLAGLMRYAFVAAGMAIAWMRQPLPPSRRRQTACVVQTVSLVVCVAPPIEPPGSALIALLGVAFLTGSFGADVAWLARNAARKVSEARP
jgi:phosphatidylglycerophosphate synthase